MAQVDGLEPADGGKSPRDKPRVGAALRVGAETEGSLARAESGRAGVLCLVSRSENVQRPTVGRAVLAGGVASGFCVYLLRDAAGRVRYVGKGRPSRAQASAAERQLDYELAAVNISEREAFNIEARLINLLSVELDNIAIPPWPRGEAERWHAPGLLSLRPPLAFTSDELTAWRSRFGLNRPQLAELLGMGTGRAAHNTIQRWEIGVHRIPPHLPLALAELERQLAARSSPTCGDA
jgi:hypothetical protein